MSLEQRQLLTACLTACRIQRELLGGNWSASRLREIVKDVAEGIADAEAKLTRIALLEGG